MLAKKAKEVLTVAPSRMILEKFPNWRSPQCPCGILMCLQSMLLQWKKAVFPYDCRIPHHSPCTSSLSLIEGEAIRDREMALRILSAVQMTGKTEDVASIWRSFTKKEQKVILDVIKKEGGEDLVSLLVVEGVSSKFRV